jgi:hypothetical protein
MQPKKVVGLDAASKARAKAAAGPRRPERHVIDIAHDDWNSTLRAAASLLKDDLFIRGGTVPMLLARAREADGEPDHGGINISGVRYDPTSLVFTPAVPGRIRFLLDERAVFRKQDARTKSHRHVQCPGAVGEQIISAALELGFRAAAGIVACPLFIRGRILAERGYQPSGIVLDIPADAPLSVPEAPGFAEAQAALERLVRPWRGFLERGSVALPAAAAAVLTAALRPSLPASPAILLDGNGVAVGKGKFARALSAVATGRAPATMTEGSSPEEFEKRLAAAIIQGAPVLLLDNLQRHIASSTLESILTERRACIRRFGTLETVTVGFNGLVLLTANNSTLRRDMLRRTLPVRICVSEEDPEVRTFDFDPVEEALRDRRELLEAAFTVARAWWLAKDEPENAGCRRPLGSFEVWSELVGGAVAWLTGQHPAELIAARKREDHFAAGERQMVEALHGHYGENRWRSKDAAHDIDATLWAEVLPRMKGDKPSAAEVGHWLRARKDRVFGVLILSATHADRNGVVDWTVTSRSAGDAGDCGG